MTPNLPITGKAKHRSRDRHAVDRREHAGWLVLIGMSRVHQHNACHFRWERGGNYSDVFVPY